MSSCFRFYQARFVQAPELPILDDLRMQIEPRPQLSFNEEHSVDGDTVSFQGRLKTAAV